MTSQTYPSTGQTIQPAMGRPFRVLFVGIGILALIITLGLFLQMSWATSSFWPWTDGRLSYIFVASILAAAAGPILWIGLTGERAATAGGAINFSVSGAGITVFLIQMYAAGMQNLLPFVVFFVAFTLTSLGMLLWSIRLPFRDTRPTPRPVRISFGVFVVVLILTGGALALRMPTIFPWPLNPASTVMFGWIFLGAAGYFLYALLRPVWGNARGQLLGFLLYDLVLIVPYVQHFATVREEHRLSLIVYVAVLIFSGLLAAYYLFVDRKLRFGNGGS